ncbi:hypothetical protein [Chondromyces apiculatus]|uniref:Lipoprotein n=1 Tax=Chondromyces apiculatus DSM 436 TaxID=1192034 RepID=A0A017SSQ6_9BACT|nr:hypothetical protein [Chondromyces apiculatus]EYE99998.1 Hypothetical protein CAP_1850 [Chondromyces apiculatus DSM 436]
MQRATFTALVLLTLGSTATACQDKRAPELVTGYDLTLIEPISGDCGSPSVILSSVSQSFGPAYAYSNSRQALLADQRFRLVDHESTTAGEVYIAAHAYNDGYALIARCGDAATCNHLAAMHKTLVRSSRPQVLCGSMPGLGAQVAAFRPIDPSKDLPGSGKAAAACARLSACQIVTNRATPDDPLLACLKEPEKFKLDCAKRPSCAEVVTCLQQP